MVLYSQAWIQAARVYSDHTLYVVAAEMVLEKHTEIPLVHL
jgi:hypothetical protein